jgi:pantetheine-phosphate adenylyltransferase
MRTTLYPGSFDPITYGHMDVISQALKVYDKVIIAILVNSSKDKGMFSFNERAEIIKKIYESNPNVEVIAIEDNTAVVDVALNNNCNTMIRGLRDLTDFADELKRSEINLILSQNSVHTVAFFANPAQTTISSTAVKQIFNLGKDISSFVPPIVIEKMKIKSRSDKNND